MDETPAGTVPLWVPFTRSVHAVPPPTGEGDPVDDGVAVTLAVADDVSDGVSVDDADDREWDAVGARDGDGVDVALAVAEPVDVQDGDAVRDGADVPLPVADSLAPLGVDDVPRDPVRTVCVADAVGARVVELLGQLARHCRVAGASTTPHSHPANGSARSAPRINVTRTLRLPHGRPERSSARLPQSSSNATRTERRRPRRRGADDIMFCCIVQQGKKIPHCLHGVVDSTPRSDGLRGPTPRRHAAALVAHPLRWRRRRPTATRRRRR